MESIQEGIYEDLETFFPAHFSNPLSQSYWRQQKQKIVAQLKSIIDGVDRSEEIEKIDKLTSNQIKVKDFMGNESEEVKYDKQFEQNCIILAPYTNQPVKTLTVKEYFNLIKFVNDKTKADRSARK